MAPRRKRPVEATDIATRTKEARTKSRNDHRLFNTDEEWNRYRSHFNKRTILPGRNIAPEFMSNFGLRMMFDKMGWAPVVSLVDPVYTQLVRCFYSKAHFTHKVFIDCNIRGKDISLNARKICEILGVECEGLLVDDTKTWPNIPGFVPSEAIKRICEAPNAHGLRKPNAHSLSIRCRVLHHIITFSIVPRGGHREELTYLEAFLVDSLLVGRKVNLGYIMLNHMIACCESTTRVLPYGRFMTKVFREFGLDLSMENEIQKISAFDTYTDSTLGRMKFVKSEDGEWKRMGDDVETDSEDDEQNNDMGEGPQPSGNLDFPPLQTDVPEVQHGDIPHTEVPPLVDGTPMHEVKAQISSLASRMDELAVIEESRFSSIEARIDSCQMRFTSQYEQLQQRVDHFEERVISQLEHLSDQQRIVSESVHRLETRLMGYLESVFPPPPPPAS